MKYLLLSLFVIGCGSNVVQFKDDTNTVSSPDAGEVNECTDQKKAEKSSQCFSEVEGFYNCNLKRADCIVGCSNKCKENLVNNDCVCVDYYDCFTTCESDCLGECN